MSMIVLARTVMALGIAAAVAAPLASASAQPGRHGRPGHGPVRGGFHGGPPPRAYGPRGGYGGAGPLVGGALLGLGVGAVLGSALSAPPAVAYAPPPPGYYGPPPPVYYGY